MGLTPHAIDEAKMVVYAKKYEARYGKPPAQSRLRKRLVHRTSGDGRISSFIKCDGEEFRGDGVRLEGREVISEPGEVAAGCVRYFVDIDNKLSVSLDYKERF